MYFIVGKNRRALAKIELLILYYKNAYEIDFELKHNKIYKMNEFFLPSQISRRIAFFFIIVKLSFLFKI